ncbi:uncharacterized protein [Callorhinus ursinus]|uniref:uncharacterized protein n=1 Tax=Callorhinus ursinus TaxID=34884 RepID=UPI003CD01658
MGWQWEEKSYKNLEFAGLLEHPGDFLYFPVKGAALDILDCFLLKEKSPQNHSENAESHDSNEQGPSSLPAKYRQYGSGNLPILRNKRGPFLRTRRGSCQRLGSGDRSRGSAAWSQPPAEAAAAGRGRRVLGAPQRWSGASPPRRRRLLPSLASPPPLSEFFGKRRRTLPVPRGPHAEPGGSSIRALRGCAGGAARPAWGLRASRPRLGAGWLGTERGSGHLPGGCEEPRFVSGGHWASSSLVLSPPASPCFQVLRDAAGAER